MRKIKIAAHSEKEYIFSGEETLSYGLKGKKHKKEAQNNIQHETKPNHEKQHVQASKKKYIQRKGKRPLIHKFYSKENTLHTAIQ